MALLENLVAGWLTVFSFGLAVVAVLAYRRSRNPKLLGIAIAFTLFFAKGVVVTVALFTTARLDAVWVPMAALDTVALLAFYGSALKP